MAAPGILKISMPGIAGKENSLATVYWDTHSKNVYLIANSLPPHRQAGNTSYGPS
ncbi:hypothetical protein [Paraflavitalea speifideaquila]|uniref:hypothetical protein n=1 Tax=Paraflavitalea speifideaquila TaxID=3076558 RepID=UPI0028EC866D|nr:hypothetical protein [Paraflavitalea speifideiaquila]